MKTKIYSQQNPESGKLYKSNHRKTEGQKREGKRMCKFKDLKNMHFLNGEKKCFVSIYFKTLREKKTLIAI